MRLQVKVPAMPRSTRSTAATEIPAPVSLPAEAAPAIVSQDTLGVASESAEVQDGLATPLWAQIAGDRICEVLLPLASLALLGCVGVTVAEVVLRRFLGSDLTSSSDWLSLLFTWLAFLGMPRALWFGKVPRLGLTRLVHGRTRECLDGVETGAVLTFFVIIIWSYVSGFSTEVNTQFSTLAVPTYVQGLAIPVGVGLMGLVTLLRNAGAVKRWTMLVGVALGAVGVLALLLGTSMNPDVALLVGVLGLLVLNAPIAVAIGVGGMAMFLQGSTAEISVPATQLLEPLGNIALLAIPLFMFMGATVARSSLGRRLGRFVQASLGWLPGGTGVACVGTSALFANLSGSAIADTAAVGTFYVPQLLESGYSRARAGALQAAAGVVGVVFPPAIAMILYSTVANVNVIDIFEAVIVPGLMLVVVMMVITVVRDVRSRETRRVRFSGRELLLSVPGALPVLIIPAILDGGILSGVFTPAESGAVAIVVTIGLGVLMGSVGLRALVDASEHAVDNAAMVMFILVMTAILDYGFTTSGIQEQVNNLLGSAGQSHLLFLILVNLIFIVVHEFVDVAPSILVIVPLVVPAATLLGVPLLQLGVVIAINSTIGAVMPPVGVNLYIAGQLAKVSPSRLIRPVMVYVAGSLFVLVLVTGIPVLSTWLPSAL